MMLIDRRTYRAKKPANVRGFVNDRTLMLISESCVSYDTPMSRRTRYGYRTISKRSFLRWAAFDVTEQLPAGEYERWEDYLKRKRDHT